MEIETFARKETTMGITYHADQAILPTPGDRGSTTRRKSTRTVRGPEGRWVADMKEDMARDRPPEPPPVLGVVATAYNVTCPHPSGANVSELGVNAWWFAAGQLEAARRQALAVPGGRLRRRDAIRFVPAGKRKPRERVEWTDL